MCSTVCSLACPKKRNKPWILAPLVITSIWIRSARTSAQRLRRLLLYFQLDGTIYCDSRDDAKEWSTIKSACKVLMFSDEELSDILRLLSAVLHLGNLKFQGRPSFSTNAMPAGWLPRSSNDNTQYGYVCCGEHRGSSSRFEVTQGKVLKKSSSLRHGRCECF